MLHAVDFAQPAAEAVTTQVELVSRRPEATDIVTFEFEAPPDLAYEPGMYASFDFEVHLAFSFEQEGLTGCHALCRSLPAGATTVVAARASQGSQPPSCMTDVT